MGQKVNPYGFRLGVTTDWKSRWFTERDYTDYLIEDWKIRDYLMRQLELFAVNGRAPRLYLSTTPFLFDAIRLYEALGFRRTGEPPHDLAGTPLVTMAKPLTP